MGRNKDGRMGRKREVYSLNIKKWSESVLVRVSVSMKRHHEHDNL